MKNHCQKGTALLFVVLISSAVLAIALGLGSIFIGEFTLVGDVISSAKAIYAADSGIEWFLYSDRQNKINPDFNGASCEGTGCVLSNGASFTIDVTYSGVTTYLKSIGSFGRSKRALEVTY